MTRVAATPLHPLFGIEQVVARIAARPGISQACSFEMLPALRATVARHAGAEIALSALEQPDLVGPASKQMLRPPTAIALVDTHVASFLFGAWSTFETIAYAANALGWSIAPADFRDITSEKGLRAVSPDDVTKRPGYAREMPRMHAMFVRHQAHLTLLKEQHSVSKHRHTVAAGGTVNPRNLVPSLDELPASAREKSIHAAIHRATWSDIGLDPSPGQPHGTRVPNRPLPLETVVREWRAAVNDVSQGFHDDVHAIVVRLGG